MKYFCTTRQQAVAVFALLSILGAIFSVFTIALAEVVIPGIPRECVAKAVARRDRCLTQAFDADEQCQREYDLDWQDAFDQCMDKLQDPFECSTQAGQGLPNCSENLANDEHLCHERYVNFLFQCQDLESGLMPLNLDEILRGVVFPRPAPYPAH